MTKFFDLRQPFFLPLWRRVLTVGLLVGWALIEMFSGSPGWAIMFGAVAAYCAYEFFVIFDPANYRESDND